MFTKYHLSIYYGLQICNDKNNFAICIKLSCFNITEYPLHNNGTQCLGLQLRINLIFITILMIIL